MINLKNVILDLDLNLKRLSKRKKSDSDNLKKAIELYKKKNKILLEIENLKFQKNKINKNFNLSNKEKEERVKISKNIDNKVFFLKNKLSKNNLFDLISKIPNIPNDSVKCGETSNDNEIIFKNELKLMKNQISHFDILKKLNWVKFEEAVKLTKSKFVIYFDEGAKLLRILKSYMLDYHIKNSYTEVFIPHVIKEIGLWNTGQFPKMKNDCYKIENEDLYLIPTSEVFLINYSIKKLFKLEELPYKLCSYSLCFRKEAGAAGKDTKGLIRLHQFNKVEITQITTQDDSYKILNKMLEEIRGILRELKIPHRVLNLCTGDLGFASAKTYDVEVWMPSLNKFVEISSISNTETFQSNDLNIKYINSKGKKVLTHTLNGSGLAIDRLIAVLVEHYYDENNNKFNWPLVLKKYIKIY